MHIFTLVFVCTTSYFILAVLASRSIAVHKYFGHAVASNGCFRSIYGVIKFNSHDIDTQKH